MAGKVTSPARPGGGATLGDLLAERGIATSPVPEPGSTPPPAATPAASDVDLSRCQKLVVRREKKGRGGKTATVVSGLGLRAADLERVARTLRRALGCGATVEDADVVLQGDMTRRVQAWLTARGARQVVIGN